MSLSVISALILLAGVLLTAVGIGYTAIRDRRTAETRLTERLTKLETKIEALMTSQAIEGRFRELETKVEAVWSIHIQQAMDAARALHSPDPQHFRRDELLEKFTEEVITQDELRELAEILTQTVHRRGPATDAEYLAASIMLRVIQARYDL